MATNPNPWNGSRVEFESFSEFLDFVAEDQPGMLDKSYQASRKTHGDGEFKMYGGAKWFGSATFEEALNYARTGWSEGTKKLEAFRAPLIEKLMPVILKPEIQYDVVGTGGLDMGRVMSGQPDPFMEWVDSETPVFGSGRQLVRVVLNLAASSVVDAKSIIARGAAAAALVDTLEAAGRRVSVVVAEAVTGYRMSGALTSLILVKRPDAPLSIDTLTFALAHPSMLRRLIFSLQERHPDQSIRSAFGVPGSYGHPADLSGEERGDIYFGAMRGYDPNFDTPESTRKWVLETLKQQGVLLDEDALRKENF
jgi:hypothetical protein